MKRYIFFILLIRTNYIFASDQQKTVIEAQPQTELKEDKSTFEALFGSIFNPEFDKLQQKFSNEIITTFTTERQVRLAISLLERLNIKVLLKYTEMDTVLKLIKESITKTYDNSFNSALHSFFKKIISLTQDEFGMQQTINFINPKKREIFLKEKKIQMYLYLYSEIYKNLKNNPDYSKKILEHFKKAIPKVYSPKKIEEFLIKNNYLKEKYLEEKKDLAKKI